MGYIIKQSRLAEEFRCITEKCPATCCSGWSVIWTDDEAERLKENCTSELYRRYIQAFPVINKYNSIRMDENDLCPFLCDGLCMIHRDLGEGYLSYTCREYPRITRLIGDSFVRSCKMTCYAVMDRLLISDNCMELMISPTQDDISAIITPSEKIERYKKLSKLEKILWDDSCEINRIFIKGSELFDIQEHGNIRPLNDTFEDIFGWRLILPQNGSDRIKAEKAMEKYCEASLRNIIKAIYMEWFITGAQDNISESASYCTFVFICAAMINAVYGAIVYARSHEELICTVCDIAGILLSEKGSIYKITEYMNNNRMDSKEYIRYLFNE